MTKARAQALASEINALFKSDVMKLGSDESFKVKYMSTGLLPIDVALPGGLPRGRMVELFGGPSSLKSYIGLTSIAEAQKNGLLCGLLDTESTFDPSWATQIGVDHSSLLAARPDTGEEALDAAEVMIRAGVDLLVFDSVAAALPQDEAGKRLHGEKIQPGRHAMMFSKGLRKLTAANDQTAIVFINQTRMNIGVTFGSPETTPGGKALLFYASIRARIQHTGKINRAAKVYDGEKWTDGRVQVSQKYKLTMEKSKLSRPFGETHFIWSLENGQIDIPSFVMAQGLELGIISQKGSSWIVGNVKVVGREKFLARLGSDLDLLEETANKVREHYDLPQVKTSQAKSPGVTKRRVLRKPKAD